jgi:DNA-binding transcriptional LysR family regulator
MNGTLREMRWAIMAAQHRSLRQAAEALHIRQSTLSRSLRDLEHQMGVTLFERTNGGTRPTIEGQEFLQAARRIVEETEELAARFRTRSLGKSRETRNAGIGPFPAPMRAKQ